jgi:hypothetical protein
MLQSFAQGLADAGYLALRFMFISALAKNPFFWLDCDTSS